MFEGWDPLLTSDDWKITTSADAWYLDPLGDPIKQTIEILSRRSRYYLFFRAYHAGRHRLLFQTEKFKSLFGSLFRGFADNLLPIVIDTYSDRLELDGFDVLKGGGEGLAEQISKKWTERRFDQIAAEIHEEALIVGDAYAIAWREDGEQVAVYPQRAEECLVARNPDRPDEVLWASKLWRSSDRFRLNLYYPTEIQKYETARSNVDASQTAPPYPTSPNQFKEVEGEPAVIPNPFDTVPVFHFANKGRLGGFGESELRPLIALQDALNKSVVDMLVAFEFMALPQRYATGVSIEYDEQGNPRAPWKPGIDRVWIAEHPEARFGQFDPAPLISFVEVQEAFRREMARISGIPMYYLLQTGQFPSGDALRMAESRLIKRCTKKQGAFGNSWRI